MGGKVAMTLALQNPDLVARLIVADIAPVAYFHHYDDLIDPILSLPLATIESRAQADQLLRQNIPEDQLRAFLLQNLVREPTGWRWRVNWSGHPARYGVAYRFRRLAARLACRFTRPVHPRSQFRLCKRCRNNGYRAAFQQLHNRDY